MSDTNLAAPPETKIVRSVLLHAPLPRVWRAVADSAELGTWFGARFEGPFVAGTTVHATIVPTAVDPAVAEQQKPYEGIRFAVEVERLEPERRLAFRWDPGPPDPAGADRSAASGSRPTTLVDFTLEPRAEGVLLTVTESGFEALPPAERAQALASNAEGWTHQMRLVERYLAGR
jgi:uncharacterized protein YndB with AHSA1/START domain